MSNMHECLMSNFLFEYISVQIKKFQLVMLTFLFKFDFKWCFSEFSVHPTAMNLDLSALGTFSPFIADRNWITVLYKKKSWKDLHWAIISVVLVIARSRLQYMADSKSDCWRGLCINEPLILVNSRKGETRSDLKESRQRTNRMDFAVTANRPSPSSWPTINEQYEENKYFVYSFSFYCSALLQ